MMTPERVDYLVGWAVETGSTPIEGAIAAAFIRRHAMEYLDFDFQKRVGGGQVLPAGVSIEHAKLWFHATRRRVDLVAYSADGATLIECKDVICWDGVRQAGEYRDLWTIAPQKPPVIGVILAGRSIDAGIAERAAVADIQVELFSDVSI